MPRGCHVARAILEAHSFSSNSNIVSMSSSSSSDSGDERKLPSAYRLTSSPPEARKRRHRRYHRESSSSNNSHSDSSSTSSEKARRRDDRKGTEPPKKKKKSKKDRPMWKEEGEISGESDDGSSSSSSSSSRSRSRSRERREQRRRRRDSDDQRGRRRAVRRWRSPPTTFQCQECGYKMFSVKAQIHHQMKYHNLDAECHLCQKRFETKTSIRSHYELEHTQEVVKCVFCKSTFDQPLEMKEDAWDSFFSHLYGEILYARLADHEEQAAK